MFAGGLLLSFTLIFFAGWLQWTEHHGWPNDSNEADDQEYRSARKRSRRLVNSLIGLCGALILLATLVGVGLVFMACWTLVTAILMVIVILAGLDAFRTYRHSQDKLRRMRERTGSE